MWYLIADEKSWCIVSHKKIIAAECVQINQSVSYYWNNEVFVGEVIGKSVQYELLKKRLEVLKKTPKPKDEGSLPSSSAVSTGKRERHPVQRLLETMGSKSNRPKKSSATKVSEEEAKRLHIKSLNVIESKKRLNEKVLEASKNKKQKTSDDEDYVAPPVKKSAKKGGLSDSDDSDDLEDVKETSKKSEQERRQLVKGIQSLPNVNRTEVNSSKSSPLTSSPSKDELLEKIAAMEAKLQQYQDTDTMPDWDGPESPSGGTSRDHGNVSPSEAPPQTEDSEEKPSGSNMLEESLEVPNNSSDDSPDKRSHSRKSSVAKRNKSKDSPPVMTLDDAVEYESLLYQLYKPDDEGVVKLRHGVYVKRTNLNSALTQSGCVTHCIRRLMPGVFKPDAILKCSLTGQKWRAAAAAGVAEQPSLDPLHPVAVQAILDYANELAPVKMWIPLKMKKAKPVFSQRLTEMKSAATKN